MSVSFYINTPSKVETVVCDNPWHGDEGYSVGTGGFRCGCDDSGMLTRHVYDVEPLNFSNANAAAVIRLLNLEDDRGCGSLSSEEVPSVLRRCLLIINSERTRSQETEDPYEEGGIDSARVISFGRNDDYIIRRVSEIRDLLVEAIRVNTGIVWG